MSQEEKIQELIVKEYKKGTLLRDIVKVVNESGFRTISGKLFQTSTISYIANSKGFRRYTKATKVQSKRVAKPPMPVETKRPDGLLIVIQEILSSNLKDDVKSAIVRGLIK